MFAEELRNDMALFVVAEESGCGDGSSVATGLDACAEERRIVAYIIAWVVPLLECQVGSIAVLPEYRRQGLGRQLMEILFQTCRELCVPDTYLEVRVSNSAAIGLYESLGFNTDGLRKKYYQDGEDAYTMARHEETD